MGFFDKLISSITTSKDAGSTSNDGQRVELGVVDYGRQKTNGGHDHRYNKGEDRTPAQKNRKRRK